VRVRFLQTTPSASPDFPFQAGQVITLSRLTPEIRQWLNDARAVLLDDEPEAAALGDAPQQAVEPRPRRRGAR
jgi:hypothetical protein